MVLFLTSAIVSKGAFWCPRWVAVELETKKNPPLMEPPPRKGNRPPEKSPKFKIAEINRTG